MVQRPGYQVHGTTRPRFAPVRAVFEENFRRHGEVGASLCVYHRGERVVDLWGGWANREVFLPWQENTLGVGFSSTKGLVALSFLMLHDRGELDYDRPVAEVWPAFQDDARRAISFRHLLEHRSGLFCIDPPLDLEDLACAQRVREALEATPPAWPAGAHQAYGAVSWGLLNAEVFRRLNGDSLGSFIAKEVAAPLRADVYLGLPRRQQGRVAKIYPFSGVGFLASLAANMASPWSSNGRLYRAGLRRHSPTRRATCNPSGLGPRNLANFTRPDVLELELPWANGAMSARGLARVYAALAGDGSFDGARLVSPESLRQLRSRGSWATDRVLRKQVGFTLGFVKEEQHLFSPNPESFGHPGAGGALGWADPVAEIAIGYVMNRLDHRLRSPRALRLCHAIHACI